MYICIYIYIILIYIDFNKENNKGSSKLKVDDDVRISKYNNIFAKVYVLYWLEEVLVD